ncbi:reverse transcriptase [Apostichopus japonicus]|uniref:Reverse transcriptase n=1 Tax=Stichopus japonicus TaxID=307972 RepID=A0A2G8JML3_STIJA|nr:reverse transcriptase [Apostichopus japonicus]
MWRRSVCCKSLDSRLRDLAWKIAHGVLITNHFRLVRWRLGDGICPRVGCKAIETMQHLLLECPFVRLVWDWFHAFVFGVIGCTQWAISSDFVLYGLLPPVCPTWVRDLLLLFAAVIRRHIWNSRCRLVFDGDVWRAEDVVPSCKVTSGCAWRRTMHGFPTLPSVDAGASLSSTIGTAFPV